VQQNQHTLSTHHNMGVDQWVGDVPYFLTCRDRRDSVLWRTPYSNSYRI